MKPASALMRWGAKLVFERPIKKLSLSELAAQLDQSGKQITDRLNICADVPANRRQLCHLIGIERWGQRRVRVAIGEPFLTEEYDHYRPSQESSWEELKAEWDLTRKASHALVQVLSEANVPADTKIEHNQYGPLSVKAWLRYLDDHASSTGRRIK
jgi:hypothetical protein